MDNVDDGTTEHPKYIFEMHDGTAYKIEVVAFNNPGNNNNNNEKMDDANKITTIESEILTNNSVIPLPSPLPLPLPLQPEAINNETTKSLSKTERQIGANELCASQNGENGDDIESPLINDSQSDNESDTTASTDNISFASNDSAGINYSDQRLNHFSDDESNSDDIVYAYRGADFEPVEVNADDETDYLEMDFEPDPVSEIEQENRQQNESTTNEIPGSTSNFEQPSLFGISPNPRIDTNLKIATHSLNYPAKTGQGYLPIHGSVISNVIDMDQERHEAIGKKVYAKMSNRNNKIDNNNTLDGNWRSNKEKKNKLKSMDTSTKSSTIDDRIAQNEYYDKTVSLSNKKYTGTIPKTNRIISRPIKMKPSKFDAQPSCSHHSENGNNRTAFGSWNHKRWKVTDTAQPSTSKNCSQINLTPASEFGRAKTASTNPKTTARSMSFPCEAFSNQKYPELSMNGKRSLASWDNIDLHESYDTVNTDDNDVMSPSVTFCSSYCNLDTIVNALKCINVLPNFTILKEALKDDENEVLSMNIPEYLIYASKRNCNYKAIVAAIEQSCSGVYVHFFQASDELAETVLIPVQAILSRLPHNGSVKNILTIKNKRFHQMNVLGKIVNVIRKFSDMRNDVNHNEFIAIPQYYRTGFICVTRKEPKS